VSAPTKAALQASLRGRSLPAEDIRRADIILRLSEGQGQRKIARDMRCSVNTVRLWQQRFQVEGLAGLYGRQQGRQVLEDTPELEAQTLERTRCTPKDDSTYWSTRKLATELGISHMRVARTWAKAGLKPASTASLHGQR